MEEQYNASDRPMNPRRKQRSKEQVFKETYLPVIIAGMALVLILIFVIGSITRAVQKNRYEKYLNDSGNSSVSGDLEKVELESQELLQKAEEAAAGYDYQGAIDILNSFSGDLSKYTNLNDKILQYEAAIRELVAWDDPSQITHLSFQLLIADPTRAFTNETYGNSFNRNFITTVEFSKILQQLCDNNYVLVELDDFIAVETSADGKTTYAPKVLYLPKNKKPVMLTQTNVNYNYYLIDSDGDMLPDAKGCGFATKLIWDGSNFTNEMVDASGNTITGAYDLVPILEEFIKKNPGFSYQGAKATLALTGYNGLLGYRTQTDSNISDADRQKAAQEAGIVIQALRDHGYNLACYTYENASYGDHDIAGIRSDLNRWTNEVVPVLGNVDIFAYAQLSDVSGDAAKFNTLQEAGFRYYLGFCEDGKSWATVTENFVRQGRIMVTGANLAHHKDWFSKMFDAAKILDPTRGDVPN